MRFVRHPLVREGSIEERAYQITIAEKAKRDSLMVVLPTGLGKTVIAALVIADKLKEGKILFLAPTRPLVEQHASFLKEVLNIEPSLIKTLTGSVPPDKRKLLWEEAKVIVATPQVVENDLLSGRIELSDVALVVFDECHRAVGNYAYVYISEKYHEQRAAAGGRPLVLGMTASPGSDEARIMEICKNLRVKSLEVRTEHDPDVAPYVFRKNFEWVRVDVPRGMKEIRALLLQVLEDKLGELHDLGVLERRRKDITKTELLELQSALRERIALHPDVDLYKALSLQAEILKLKHAIELVETQGLAALRRYFERLRNEAESRGGSQAARRLVEDERVRRAMLLASVTDEEHPKLEALKKILRRQLMINKASRIIVFTNFRDTAEMITAALQDLYPQVRAVRFVGQSSKADDKGLKQKEQVEIIRKFREGEYNVLVATSVAEEGLDVPSTDLVVFYEPIPSEIRSIQRKGRAGRRRIGKVVILIAKGTRDEAYYWLSRRKELKMLRKMSELSLEREALETPAGARLPESQAREREHERERERGRGQERGQEGAVAGVRDVADGGRVMQKSLQDFLAEREAGAGGASEGSAGGQKVKIFVDQRELRSQVVKHLMDFGVELEFKNLEVGDYVLSERVGVERKTAADFLSSLVSAERSLLRQVKELADAYERPLLIIEGDLRAGRTQVHPNALRGALAAILTDFGVPVIRVEDGRETAALLYAIARREQLELRRAVSPHGRKTAKTLKEQQEYIVSSIPGVGITVARNLLRHFKTVERVMTASEEELMAVERVGAATARRIREVLTAKYED
ncbi:MAG: DEAD/DEAH box helicase [Candidatus Alkanophagales archaeon]